MDNIPGTGISFHKGGLHESLGVAKGQPIPPAKMKAALAGKHGSKAKRQAELARTLEGMNKPAVKGGTPMAKAAGGKY
jgi:hypothetical protein